MLEEEVTVNDDLLDDYLQIGNSAPTNSTKEGSDVQSVDLTEILNEGTDPKHAVMVSGLEAFSAGAISKKIAKQLDLPNIEKYDPFASSYNARLGKESFFSAVMETVEKTITWLIKVVRNCIMWIINLVKQLFGFKLSDRREKEFIKGTEELKTKLVSLANKCGIPAHLVDPDNYIGDLPEQTKVEEQLILLGKKNADEQESILNLMNTGKDIPKLANKIEGFKNRLEKDINNYNKVITEEYLKFKKIQQNGRLVGRDSSESTELLNIARALKKTRDERALEEICDIVVQMANRLTGLSFTNEELKNATSRITKLMADNVYTHKVSYDNGRALYKNFSNDINDFAIKYNDIRQNEIKLTNRDWKNLGSFANVDDVDKIKEMDDHYKLGGALVGEYLNTASFVKDFLMVATVAVREINRAEQQIKQLITWHSKFGALITSMLADDFAAILAITGQNAANLSDDLDLNVMREVEARTVMEHASELSQPVLEGMGVDIKKSVSNFKKQLGIR